MAFPTRRDLDVALLVLIGQSGRIRPSRAAECLADHFQLTKAERNEERSSGVNKWKNEVAFARQSLVEKGWVSREEYGIWKLTQTGVAEFERVRSTVTISCAGDPDLADQRDVTSEDVADSINVSRIELETIREKLSQTATTVDLQGMVNQLAATTKDVNASLKQMEELMRRETSDAHRRLNSYHSDLDAALNRLRILEEDKTIRTQTNLAEKQNTLASWGLIIALIALLISAIPFIASLL